MVETISLLNDEYLIVVTVDFTSKDESLINLVTLVRTSNSKRNGIIMISGISGRIYYGTNSAS